MRDYESHQNTHRELNQVSLRGQSDDAVFSANVRTEDLSYDGLKDHHYAVEEATGEPIYSHERGVKLSALQQSEGYRGTDDIDSYAEALLLEMGVGEKGLQDMTNRLATAKTTRKRPGFVGPEQLAKN